ncbi:MAG: CHAT domain-containing protein [Blastocatellales bacterium]
MLIFSESSRTTQAGLAQPKPDERLVFGETIERELSGGEEHRYVFAVEAGKFVQAVVEQRGIDVIVAIRGQDGKPLAEVDRPNESQGPENTSFIAPDSGGYRLQIRSYQKVSIRGRYRITLKAPRAASSPDEKRIEAERTVSEAERLRGKNTADTLRQAAAKFERAQSLWRDLGESYEEAVALYGAGWSHRALGANQTAVAAFNRALELMRKVDDRFGIAFVQAGVGWSYLHLGDLDQALESFNQSLQLRRGLMNPTGEGQTHYGIGWVRTLREENQLALESFEQSLRLRQVALDRRGEAITRIGLGKIYSRLRRYDESRAMLEQAFRTLRELGDSGGQADALSHLGWIGILLKQNAEARKCFQEALKLWQGAGDRTGEATSSFGLALLASRDGSLLEARELIERGLEIIESLRTEGNDHRLRTAYFAQVQDYYDFYIDLLMRLGEREPGDGHSAEALHASERARARNLLDLLARAGAHGSELGRAQPLRADEIQQQLLDEETVLLEYTLGAERSFLWLVTRTGVESYLLPKRSEIEAEARRIFELLTVRNHNHRGARKRELAAQSDTQFQVASQELSRMLLGPVAAKLTGKRLLIVPHGALQFVPFAALPLPEMGRQGDKETRRQGGKETGRKGNIPHSYTPLIAAHEIVVIPSASALAAIRRQTATRTPAERGLIVFADPVFSPSDDRVRQFARQRQTLSQGELTGPDAPSFGAPPILSNLSRLSVTAWEAQQIASLSSDSRVVRDFAANRDAAIDPALGKYRVIHFATHAVINSQKPDLSAIVLSQVNEQGLSRNGALSAQDIHHLRLQAELVVLSACRSGWGKDARGEGLLSLTRGFLSSGAARVMVSLWSVEDQATAELMSRFYRRTLGPKRMAPAAALRATQAEMWREGRWGAPYYWGGFVLQGEWR